jgi:plastocyanin
MKGKVKVVPKGKAIPTAKQDTKTAANQFAAEVKTAKKLAKLTPPANTIQGGNDKPPVVQLRFFPQTIQAKVGQPLTVQVKSVPEVHTFSFGPAAYLNQVANALAIPQSNGSVLFNPQIAYPSDAPPLPAYTGSNHGNGFFSTGLLDGDPNSPFPSSTQITFSQPGTYGFICLIHPFMQGQVVVTN